MRFEKAHLTYCMNVHPASSMVEVMHNIEQYAVPVKERVSPDGPFALGLWLSAGAASQFLEHAARFCNLLTEHDLYVPTFNGFPYGIFHGESVKTKVYQPNWGDKQRLAYTEELLVCLASLLRPGETGTISTVPIAYGKQQPPLAIEYLLEAAQIAQDLSHQKNIKLVLALEPEPDCCLENTDDVLLFFDQLRQRGHQATEHIGVCLDTCHFALQHEAPADAYRRMRSAGIAIPKVQLSAALRYRGEGDQAGDWLRAYAADSTYLHQTRVVGETKQAFADLPEALAASPSGEWVIHFHVPLHFSGDGPLGSTACDLTPAFLAELAQEEGLHIEIETYTFGVLPEPAGCIIDSISDEFAFVRAQFDSV